MYNLMKKRSSYLREDKATPTSKKLSPEDLAYHHGKLADHYGEVSKGGGINPGAESDRLAGDESKYEHPELGGSIGEKLGGDRETEPSLAIDGEDVEDVTGMQESSSYEKGESEEQEALEDLGTFQGAGGGLLNSKEEKPLSTFKKKGKKGY